jgi:hypothetical protein
MAWLRHAALIRTLTLFLLLWVGSDLGAHGFFSSDLAPISTGNSSFRLTPDQSGSTVPFASDHCFCHSTSVGAVVAAPVAGLTPVGTVGIDPSLQVPPGAPHPLDRPPQLAA